MTNIVGGNTGNLSLPGSSQDGSSSNPLSKNASLDFLSLISVAYEGQKDSSAESSKLDNADKSLNIIRNVMESAHKPLLNLSVPLIADTNSGKNWDEAH